MNAENSKEKTNALTLRDSIDERYKWNLDDIYANLDEWEKEFKWIEESITQYAKFRGTLALSSDSLAKAIAYDEEIGIKIGKLYLYIMLLKDLDISNNSNQILYDRTVILSAKAEAESSFLKPEILAIERSKLIHFISANEFLKIYSHFFDDLYRIKEHTLEEDKERMLAKVSPALSTPYNAFSFFNNADIEFPLIKGENGDDEKITHGRYSAAMYSLDREYRKRFYFAYYKPFIKNKNTLAALFSGNLHGLIFNSSSRKYNSSREASLDANNIPLKVYDTLTANVKKNLSPLHRWVSIKKKLLKLDEFHSYDIHVTLFPSLKKIYSYDESIVVIMNALKPLGDDYNQNLTRAFENRWIDVFETPSKRSGAYSSGTTFGVHPYVLLNWSSQLNDVFTLAHEMGHNMHSYYTGKNQPFPYANYSIFNAEVTSTVNEALLLDYLIDNASSDEEKLYLIEKNITNTVSTFYRQTMFAIFEQEVHELIEKDQALSAELLCEMNSKLHHEFWGPEMEFDEEETFTWARVPHFYYNFYVYQYATSYAASQIIVAKIRREGESAVNEYIRFLKAGSSAYPLNTLKSAGVDMISPNPILAVAEGFNHLLDQIEKIIL